MNRWIALSRILGVLILAGLSSMTCWAQDRNDVLPNRQPGAVDAKIELRMQNEAVAIEFVKLHHSELEQYLSQLKKQYPAHYVRATTEIARQANRINQLKEKNPPLYDYSVENWKLDSRIKLQAIKNTVDPSAENYKELVLLVERHLDLQYRKVVEDRDRLLERVEKLNQQIENYEKNPETYFEQRLNSIQRRAKNDVKNAQRGIKSKGQNKANKRDND